jgi:carboxymethylenebutenolidase
MTGGIGREALTDFYRDHFIFSNPDDANLQVISRTVGADRLIGMFQYQSQFFDELAQKRISIEELIYHGTHDRTLNWLMPGVPPTGKKLSIPMVAVVNVRGDRLYNGKSVYLDIKIK